MYQLHEKKYRQIDNNINFYQLLTKEKQIQIDKDIDVGSSEKRISVMKIKVRGLDKEDRQQWLNIQTSKIVQTYQKYQITRQDKSISPLNSSRLLRENLRIFVVVCSSEGINYEVKMIERIIKEAYFNLYGRIAINVFVRAGYNTEELEFLVYNQQQPSSFIKMLMCCCFSQA